VCTEEYGDDTLTSTADRTGCEVNEALLNTLADSIYTDGGALGGTFFFVALFIAVGGTMTYMREQEPERLASLTRLEALYNSFLPGFNVGADILLLVGILATDRGLGVTMMMARLFHITMCIILAFCLFGNVNKVKAAQPRLDSVVKEAWRLRELLDEEWARENIYWIEAVVVLALFDVTMLQFLPWKKSHFYVKSEGYPCLGIMKACLATKTIYSVISVTCEITFLVKYSNSNSPTTSVEAQALFYLNILGGVGAVVIDTLMLCMRGGMLRVLDPTTKRGKLALEAKERAHSGEKMQHLEMSDVYGKKDNGGGGEGGDDDGDAIPNPLLDADALGLREIEAAATPRPPTSYGPQYKRPTRSLGAKTSIQRPAPTESNDGDTNKGGKGEGNKSDEATL
jgi:hypothetical protein